MSRYRTAFTLVELSIVLVILGLLVGGVLAGQTLIHAAELRAVTTEFNGYKVAIGAFKEKYFALPGDMSNAVRFWGAQAGGTSDGVDATCADLAVAATSAATCNGDGDGFAWRYASGASGNPHEAFRAWQHLANAGLVQGKFSGIANTGSYADGLIGTNIPRSKLPQAGWSFYGAGTISGNGDVFDGNYGNSLLFGAQVSGDLTVGPALKPQDAYNIDTKMDDGKPNTGSVVSLKNNYSPNCVPVSNDVYSLTGTAPGCALFFQSGF